MTEDEALKIALDLLAEPARHGFYFEDDEHEAVRIALPRIQSALRLAEAVEWMERVNADPTYEYGGWTVGDYETDQTAHKLTLPEAVSALRAKLSHDPGHEPKE